MTVLLDLDVLIDVALDREPFAKPATELLDALEARPGSAFIAWHSLANFYYLVSPAQGRHDAKRFLVDLTRFVDVAPTTTTGLHFAAQLPMRDFEDAMQVAAATACDASVIATRNLRDYRNSPIRAAAPHDVLRDLSVARPYGAD